MMNDTENRDRDFFIYHTYRAKGDEWCNILYNENVINKSVVFLVVN